MHVDHDDHKNYVRHNVVMSCCNKLVLLVKCMVELFILQIVMKTAITNLLVNLIFKKTSYARNVLSLLIYIEFISIDTNDSSTNNELRGWRLN